MVRYQTTSGPPPPTVEADEPSYLGVPQGYHPPPIPGANLGPQSGGSGPPLYQDGDQFMGANRSPTEIANLQRALVAARLLDAFRIGVWDDETASAFEALLVYANRRGITWGTALRALQSGEVGQVDEFGNIVTGSGAGAAGGGGAGGGGLVVQLTDPESLRSTFEETAAALRGQGFSEQQIGDMVAAYQAVERQRQTQAYQASEGVAASGGVAEVTSIPSPQEWAEAEVERRDPSGVMGRDVLDRFNQFFALLGATQGTGT